MKINRIEELTDEMVSMFVEYVKEYSNNIYRISLSVLANFFDYLYDNAITQKRFVIHERIYVYTKKLIDGNNKYPFINISEYFSINDSPRFNKFDKRKIIHFELLNYQSNFELIYEWSIFQCKNGYCGFNLLQHKINTICAFSNYISKKWCEISREDFLRYKKHLFDKNYKIETINEKIRPLLEFVLWGVSKGKDINNFTEKHDLEKRNYIKANNDISMYNLQQLFYHLPKIREDVRIMIIIMMQTGMRQSEVSHLEYDCVYEFNDSFYIKYYSSKGKKYNTNIISKKLYEIISIYKENSENPNRKYLFSSQFGNVISGDVMNAELKRIIEDNDLKDETGKKLKITNHCFRHTVAELLRDNGASPYVIKEVLHHDAIDMTYKYVNSSKDKIIARYNSLSSEAKGETELSDNFVPEKYSVNDVNNKLIEILLYGSCSRNKKIGKCKDSPSECYMCSHFNYDEEYYNSYIDQYNRVSSLIMVYIKNTIEVPDNLLNLKLKLEEIIQSIQKQCSCNKKGIEKANEKFI